MIAIVGVDVDCNLWVLIQNYTGSNKILCLQSFASPDMYCIMVSFHDQLCRVVRSWDYGKGTVMEDIY